MSTPAHRVALRDAETDGEILAALAALMWHKEGNKDQPPNHRVPTSQDLAEWTEIRTILKPHMTPAPQKIDPPTLIESTRRLCKVAPNTFWQTGKNGGIEAVTNPPKQITTPIEPRNEAPDSIPFPPGLAVQLMEFLLSHTNEKDPFQTNRFHAQNKNNPDGLLKTTVLGPPSAVHAAWKAMPDEKRPRHPLGPIVRSWQKRAPIPLAPLGRKDRRLIPSIVTGGGFAHPARERGAQLAILKDEGGVKQLPMIPEKEQYRVPLLDLVDEAGLPVMARGRGAPLELRLPVSAILSVHQSDWEGRLGGRFALPLKDLTGAYWAKYKKAKDWPKLRSALMKMDSYRIVIDNVSYRLLSIWQFPQDGDANGMVDLEAKLPPGASGGPPIDLDTLNRLGRQSGPGFRSYLAGRSIVWQPGKTRRKIRDGFHIWKTDPKHYPLVTLANLERLAYGAGDRKHRTKQQILEVWREANVGPHGLIISDQAERDPETRREVYRIMPSEAIRDTKK